MKKNKMNREQLIKLSKTLFIISLLFMVLAFLYGTFIEGYLIFRNEEALFTKSAKSYYDINTQYLPDKGEVKTISLQKLYSLNKLDTLYVPKTYKLCDVDSWVKIIKNDDGSYKYYTYLKCGKYQSSTDHEGPVITLNGDSSIINALDSEYSELGVKSVIDKNDGKLDTAKVVIDSSSVDVKNPGIYTVTYKAYDKLKNVTKVTRTVTVIESLSDRITKDTASTNVYKGINLNNYVLFSGMLWEIVKINEDGTIKLVLFDNAANLSYGDGVDYNSSNIKKWLNSDFYNSLSSSKYIEKSSKWCIDSITNINSITDTCTNYSDESPVGMLTLAEYKNAMDLNGYNYLFSRNSYRFINRSSENSSWILFSNGSSPYYSYQDTNLVGVRPVINIKDNLYIVSGDGSGSTPFKLNDYSYGKENSKLSSRLVGEYIFFSGYSWRKIGTDDDGNVKLIMADTISKVNTSSFLTAGYSDNTKQRIFNPTEEGNLGYVVNEEIIDYLDDSYLVKHSFTLPTYDATKSYKDYETDTFKALISIPTSYDLFSGSNGNEELRNGSYWLLDTQKDTPNLFMINQSNGITFTVDQNLYTVNGLKLVIYLSGDEIISSGKGVVNSPYYIK